MLGRVPAILFESSSTDAVSGIRVDHVGMNILIHEPVSSSDARIGYPLGTPVSTYKNTDFATVPNDPRTFNSLLLHRRGIYGFASWSPLENSYNPLVRAWKQENTIAINSEPGDMIVSLSPKYETKRDRFGSLQTFTEPPVTSRNFPLKLILDVNTAQGIKKAKIESVFGNEVDNFTDPALDEALYMTQKDGVAYNKVKDMYLDGALGSPASPVDGFRSLTYKQTVYPKSRNAFLLKTRERPGYTNSFWRSTRNDRATLGGSKFSAHGALSGGYSAWSMDADTDFSTAISGTTAGILQNNKTHIHHGTKSNIVATCVYGWTHTLEASASTVSRAGLDALANDSTSNCSAEYQVGNIQIGGGNALWQVGPQAGYYDISGTFVSSPSRPWSNSYDDFVSEMRAHNKDYSVIPEFRISDHVDNIVKNRDGDFFSHIPAFLSIKGAASSHPKNSSESDFYKVYTNSDFMKQFDIIREDHRDFVNPDKIKLTCKAIKKFIPYNGFYPPELIPELYLAFSSSYADKVSYSGADSTYVNAKIRPFITPICAPGIWNNMIKAGIAVDFPVQTGSFEVQKVLKSSGTTSMNYRLMSTGSDGGRTGFLRMPFETIVNPEKYLTDVSLVDMCVHPSAALDITGTLGGVSDDIYKMRAHNALSSMIEFFLPGENNKGKLEELSSAPEDSWGRFEGGERYGMTIKLRKSYNKSRQAQQIKTNKYPIPQDSQLDIDSGLKQSITMYSMPSTGGPPMSGRKGAFPSAAAPTDSTYGSHHTAALDSMTGCNPAWSPGYSDGEVWAHLLYQHSGNSQPSLDTIFASGTIIPWRFDALALSQSNGGSNAQPYGFNNINEYAMQLSSSVNIYGKRRNPTTETGPAGQTISNTTNTSQATNTWVISPKMTTPILNFNEAIASIPTNGSESVPRGMWHQFGQIESTAVTSRSSIQRRQRWSRCKKLYMVEERLWHQWPRRPISRY